VASRPGTGAVITISILHFIGGGLGLIYSLCNGLGLIIIAQGAVPAAQPGDVNALNMFLLNNAPGYLAMQIANAAIGLVFDLLLIVAGIGLLMRGSWARYVSIGYGVLSLLVKIVMVAHVILFVNPALQKFKAQEPQKVNDPVLRQQIQSQADMAAIVNPCTYGVMMIYPAVVILVMLMPNVGRYFQSDRRDDREDYDRDSYEDDYPRRGSRIDRSGQIYRDDEDDDRGRRRWRDDDDEDDRRRRWRDDDR
jgi:hypothetical protein